MYIYINTYIYRERRKREREREIHRPHSSAAGGDKACKQRPPPRADPEVPNALQPHPQLGGGPDAGAARKRPVSYALTWSKLSMCVAHVLSIYIYGYIYIYVHVHVQVYVRIMFVSGNLHMYVLHLCIYTYNIDIRIHMYVCVYICMYTCMHTYKHKQISWGPEFGPSPFILTPFVFA